MPGQFVGTQGLALLGQSEECVPADDKVKDSKGYTRARADTTYPQSEPSSGAQLVLVPGGHGQEPEECFVLLWDVSIFLGYQGAGIFSEIETA